MKIKKNFQSFHLKIVKDSFTIHYSLTYRLLIYVLINFNIEWYSIHLEFVTQ